MRSRMVTAVAVVLACSAAGWACHDGGDGGGSGGGGGQHGHGQSPFGQSRSNSSQAQQMRQLRALGYYRDAGTGKWMYQAPGSSNAVQISAPPRSLFKR